LFIVPECHLWSSLGSGKRGFETARGSPLWRPATGNFELFPACRSRPPRTVPSFLAGSGDFGLAVSIFVGRLLLSLMFKGSCSNWYCLGAIVFASSVKLVSPRGEVHFTSSGLLVSTGGEMSFTSWFDEVPAVDRLILAPRRPCSPNWSRLAITWPPTHPFSGCSNAFSVWPYQFFPEIKPVRHQQISCNRNFAAIVVSVPHSSCRAVTKP